MFFQHQAQRMVHRQMQFLNLVSFLFRHYDGRFRVPGQQSAVPPRKAHHPDS